MKVKILALVLGICFLLSGCHALLIAPAKEKRAEKRRADYIAAHLDLSKEVKLSIQQGDLLIGMTWKDVIASLGDPYDINLTTGSWGVHAQFCYLNPTTAYYYPGWEHLEYAYVYLENGIVTSWQSR